MAAKKHTDEQRAEALALYAEHGLAEAHRRTSIAKGTISSWARRTGVQTSAPGNMREANEAAAMAWEQRRLALKDKLGQAVEEFVEAARRVARGAGSAKDAQALMTAAAIGVDKAQLLAGGATARTEVDVSDPGARLAAVHELKDQAAKRAGREAG